MKIWKASRPASRQEPGPDLRTVRLDGGMRDAVYALSAGLELFTRDWPRESDPERPVYDSGVRLARQIADAALDVPGAPADAELGAAARAHFGRVLELAAEYGEEPFSLDGHEPGLEALAEAGALLREQALEHHTFDLQVATERDTGARLLVGIPVSVEQAHIWLSGSLYEKVESWVREDPLAATERLACHWWLHRWRGPRPLAGDEFAAGVREQEFALVERPLRCMGLSPLGYLVAEGLLEDVGPRQRHMAEQLLHSVADVWLVQSRSGHDAVFVDPLDGTRYRVREHATTSDNSYGPGFLAVGRLIPFGNDGWLRSPGTFMLSFGDESVRVARSLAEHLRSQMVRMPAPAVLEALTHTLCGATGLPRDVPPAPTPDDAAGLARELTLMLQEAGVATPAGPDSPLAHRLAPGKTEVLQYEVDIVLAEFIDALYKQSQKSRLVRQAKRRLDRKARKKKGRR
jgi:hypothetical protein